MSLTLMELVKRGSPSEMVNIIRGLLHQLDVELNEKTRARDFKEAADAALSQTELIEVCHRYAHEHLPLALAVGEDLAPYLEAGTEKEEVS